MLCTGTKGKEFIGPGQKVSSNHASELDAATEETAAVDDFFTQLGKADFLSN